MSILKKTPTVAIVNFDVSDYDCVDLIGLNNNSCYIFEQNFRGKRYLTKVRIFLKNNYSDDE